MLSRYNKEVYDLCPPSLIDLRALILTEKAKACFCRMFDLKDSMYIAQDACYMALVLIPGNMEALKLRGQVYRQIRKIKSDCDCEKAIFEPEEETTKISSPVSSCTQHPSYKTKSPSEKGDPCHYKGMYTSRGKLPLELCVTTYLPD